MARRLGQVIQRKRRLVARSAARHARRSGSDGRLRPDAPAAPGTRGGARSGARRAGRAARSRRAGWRGRPSPTRPSRRSRSRRLRCSRALRIRAQRMDIARRCLRDLQVQKAAAHGRLAPDDFQVAAVEQHGIDLADHFGQARVPDAVDPRGFFFGLGQQSVSISMSLLLSRTTSALTRATGWSKRISSVSLAARVDLLVARIYRAFQQVALALRVAPDKDVQSRSRLDTQRRVVPEVFQFQRSHVHGFRTPLPFLRPACVRVLYPI